MSAPAGMVRLVSFLKLGLLNEAKYLC